MQCAVLVVECYTFVGFSAVDYSAVQCAVFCKTSLCVAFGMGGGLHMGELPPKLQSPEIMIFITFIIIAVGDDDKVRVVMMGAMDM